uniref:Transmembrane protein n=1 Tax=Nicotiana tabacum TaxID=4097 RepID=A0A1S4CIX4_TOBAC|nr:PREDICTED: uncharacterized protein LOC107819557 [Nicotiana tabacum]
MSGRTFILILFFWAVLTIVTPVLVRLSASAKANGEFFVIKHTSDLKERIKDGKVMELLPRRALVAVAPPRKESMPPLAPVLGPFPARHVDEEVLEELVFVSYAVQALKNIFYICVRFFKNSACSEDLRLV